MTTTTFVDGTTPVVASWLNDVNSGVYKAASATTGTVDRLAVDKFKESISVKDFGASGLGVIDATTAFTAAAAASNDVVVPAGTYLLNTTPTMGASTIRILKGATLTGAGAAGLPIANGTGIQTVQANSSGTDFALAYYRREANHTGGTAGYVNSGIRLDHNVGANVTDYEWGITTVMNNSATAGNNVALYGQGNRQTSSTGPTWAGVMEARETVPIANPTTGLVGLEVDVRSNGLDSNFNRIGVDVVCARHNASGAGTQTGYGIRVQNLSDASSTVVIGVGIVANACTIGFDTSSAIIGTSALRMAAGQKISFDANSTNQFYYDSTGTPGLAYRASNSDKVKLQSDGSILLSGTNALQIKGLVNSGAATPTLGTNKPGANGAPATWISVFIDGTQYWMPVWGN